LKYLKLFYLFSIFRGDNILIKMRIFTAGPWTGVKPGADGDHPWAGVGMGWPRRVIPPGSMCGGKQAPRIHLICDPCPVRIS
ncbi:MAG: hypothetical protein QNJ04_03715, partial [Desulfobacterales bacterium]|nr:hypothetical protein [Desulfobacterales bacterium]